MFPGLLEAARPELRDSEVHEHEGAVLGPHGKLVGLSRSIEHGVQSPHCLLGVLQIATSPGELDLDDGQVHDEEAPSLGWSCRRESPCDVQMRGRLVEQAVEDVVDRERCREVSVTQMRVGLGTRATARRRFRPGRRG